MRGSAQPLCADHRDGWLAGNRLRKRRRAMCHAPGPRGMGVWQVLDNRTLRVEIADCRTDIALTRGFGLRVKAFSVHFLNPFAPVLRLRV